MPAPERRTKTLEIRGAPGRTLDLRNMVIEHDGSLPPHVADKIAMRLYADDLTIENARIIGHIPHDQDWLRVYGKTGGGNSHQNAACFQTKGTKGTIIRRALVGAAPAGQHATWDFLKGDGHWTVEDSAICGCHDDLYDNPRNGPVLFRNVFALCKTGPASEGVGGLQDFDSCIIVFQPIAHRRYAHGYGSGSFKFHGGARARFKDSTVVVTDTNGIQWSGSGWAGAGGSLGKAEYLGDNVILDLSDLADYPAISFTERGWPTYGFRLLTGKPAEEEYVSRVLAMLSRPHLASVFSDADAIIQTCTDYFWSRNVFARQPPIVVEPPKPRPPEEPFEPDPMGDYLAKIDAAWRSLDRAPGEGKYWSGRGNAEKLFELVDLRPSELEPFSDDVEDVLKACRDIESALGGNGVTEPAGLPGAREIRDANREALERLIEGEVPEEPEPKPDDEVEKLKARVAELEAAVGSAEETIDALEGKLEMAEGNLEAAEDTIARVREAVER